MSEGPSSPSGVSPSKSPSRRLIRSPLSYGLAINPNSGSTFNLPTEFIKLIEKQKNELESEEGAMQCPNTRIHEGDDILYHLGLSNRDNLQAMFGDVKFVLMGGSHERAETVAISLSKRLGLHVPVGYKLSTIGKTERFSMFKVGPVISINHGMGMPSMLILLHEITKLLYHARAKDVWYIRIGTSGGLGLPAGTVVVSEEGMNGKLEPFYEQIVLGRVVQRNTQLDPELRQLALECAAREPAIPCVQGKTMGTDDFYEGQGRLDGAIVDYEEEERNAWLRKAHEVGVRNIEMEAPAFAAWCLRMNIPGLLCCAVLLNRLEGDQVKATHDELGQYSANAQEVAMRVIMARLGLDQPEVNEEAAATQ